MPRTMKAAVLVAANDVQMQEVPQRDPGPGEVLVRVAYCGICPSDVRVYAGRKVYGYPTVLGHEFSGWVDEVGPGVTSLKAGDPVVVDPMLRCVSECAACRRGVSNKCMNLPHGTGGNEGLAQYAIAPANHVYRLKESTDLVAACFGEPLACVLHGQHRANIRAGSTACIVGSGPIGLLHLMCAKAAGARVIVSEPTPARLNVAADFGADVLVNPAQQDVLEAVKAETDGWGADAVIVAVGNKAATESAVSLLAPQGTVVLFAGMYPNLPITLDANAIHYSEINITGSSDYTDPDFFESVRFIESGIIPTRKLVAEILPFEQTKEALDHVMAGDRLKVVVQVNPQ